MFLEKIWDGFRRFHAERVTVLRDSGGEPEGCLPSKAREA